MPSSSASCVMVGRCKVRPSERTTAGGVIHRPIGNHRLAAILFELSSTILCGYVLRRRKR